MALTTEQKAASEKLGQAIVDLVSLLGDGLQAGVVTDWIVVAAQDKFDNDGDRVTSYNVLYRDGSLPDHIARGLMHSALDLVSGGWQRQEDS